MANVNQYDVGDVLYVGGHWTDPENSDLPLDPDVVKCTVYSPDGTETTYVYNTDPEVIRVSEGWYTMNIDLDTAGKWCYRWWSTGNGQAAERSVVEARAKSGL